MAVIAVMLAISAYSIEEPPDLSSASARTERRAFPMPRLRLHGRDGLSMAQWA